MKKIAIILSSLSFITVGSAIGTINNSINHGVINTKSKIQNIFTGTKTANVKIEQTVSDVAMGGAKRREAPASHNFEWSDIQIDQTIVPKMDYTRSWLKLDVNYWYSDNSGSGNSGEYNINENLVITKSSFDSGVRSYDNDRHHAGKHRLTDHQWKWQVKVNQEGIYLWDWVWVWANGNWGNKATSMAGINIKSFEYHFEFLI